MTGLRTDSRSVCRAVSVLLSGRDAKRSVQKVSLELPFTPVVSRGIRAKQSVSTLSVQDLCTSLYL